MKESNECVVKNGDVLYKISKNNNEFLTVNKVGSKKEILLKNLEFLLTNADDSTRPAVSRIMFQCVVAPLENNQPFTMSADLLFQVWRWASTINNFHIARGNAGKKILKTILGIIISIEDVTYRDQYGNYLQLEAEEMYFNFIKKIEKQKDLIIQNSQK